MELFLDLFLYLLLDLDLVGLLFFKTVLLLWGRGSLAATRDRLLHIYYLRFSFPTQSGITNLLGARVRGPSFYLYISLQLIPAVAILHSHFVSIYVPTVSMIIVLCKRIQLFNLWFLINRLRTDTQIPLNIFQLTLT